MSKRSRYRRALQRREDRYLTAREKPEDLDIDYFGWSRSEVRRLRKWERQRIQLLFLSQLAYENWLHFHGEPVLKGKR